MANYVEINNYSGLGKIGISRKTLETIASHAVLNIKGASLSKKTSPIFQISKPVKAEMSKNGIACISVSVNIAKGHKVQDICIKIQEEIIAAIKIMCETIPVSVKIKVESVD